MENREVARRAKAMTRKQVIMKAIDGQLTWIQASEVLGITARQMRRLKLRYEAHGYDGLVDGRGGRTRRKRIPLETIRELCRLKRELYPDFSIQHFHEHATEKHGLKLSYTWTRLVLEEVGIVKKAPARGKYRRRRERRPMIGMLIHLDGSTHEWIKGLPMEDLVVALDDADGRILSARFFPEEGTRSTLDALQRVLTRYGRFCELYTDRGSHFGHTPRAGGDPDPDSQVQVSRVLKSLGIRQIYARSPEARGRSERNFGTLQGRLPQELRLHGVTTYEQANHYLEEAFVPDFNCRFTVTPQLKDSAFVRLAGIDLGLALSIHHERVVRNDNTVIFGKLFLQLPQHPSRPHFVRCPVIVHEFLDGTLGVSYQHRLLARYDAQGGLLPSPHRKRQAA